MTEQPEIKISQYGTKEWYLNGELHRTDGPARIYLYGTKEWYQYGQRHRIDGPAVARYDGSKFWFLNGKLHRTDGPAIETPTKQNKQDPGLFYLTIYLTLDSHAIEIDPGDKCWYQNDKLHRINGPAIERADGTKEWYLNGKRIPEDLLPWYITTIYIKEIKS